MAEQPFPPGLPDHLAAAAFVSGCEAAWPPDVCAEVFEWLRQKGIATLGTEMWIVRDGTIWGSARTSAGEAFYGNACDPEPGERWEVYVNRSAREATDTVINPWWRAELTEPEPYRIYFNVTWADRTWFQAQGEFL